MGNGLVEDMKKTQLSPQRPSVGGIQAGFDEGLTAGSSNPN